MDTLTPDTNALHLLGLTAFAQANPDRALLVILPSAVALQPPEEPGQLVQTVLFGQDSREDDGELLARIRFQRDLQLRSLCFYGSTPGEAIRIQGVYIGDEPVFVDKDGVTPDRFNHPALIGVVEGWRAGAGLDLTVLAKAVGPAKLAVNVIGLKRILR